MDPANERRYQVFVSSTFVDLQEERRKVLDAILETQSFPAGMELFPSADEEQFEFIKREIESSDYYVVIVAGRYGSLAPDGLSFTEKEYDYAISLAKPVMAFLHKDLGELKGKALEPEQAQRERLLTFRAKVAAEKLVKFYSNADDLKAQVAQALNAAFRLKPQVGWVRATNARRNEDAEEIAKLNNQLIELETDLMRYRDLSADPKRLSKYGNSDVTLTLSVSSNDRPRFVDITVSWDELLLSIFEPAEIWLVDDTVEQRILDLMLHHMPDIHPKRNYWAYKKHMPRSSLEYDRKSLRYAALRVATHLHGLGYVELEARLLNHLTWRITSEGRARIASLLGSGKSQRS